MRPPLKPLNKLQFQKMIADADIIAIGTVIHVVQSKNAQPTLETITVQATLHVEKILKGDRKIINIVIEESCQQFIRDNPDNDDQAEKAITAHIAGPGLPIGQYHNGDRIVVLLQPVAQSTHYCPLGSGKHDAYLGVFLITPEGIRPYRYRFDETVAGYARSEAELIDFIQSCNCQIFK